MRLDYHSTYMASVRSSKLPHYQTDFSSPAYGRHPLDYKYDCGFSPEGKSLKQCINHWNTCKHQQCRQKFYNWLELKRELLEAYR